MKLKGFSVCVEGAQELVSMPNVKSFSFADMDGQNRHRAMSGTLPHMFAVSLFEDWVYWTDWNTHTVEKAHKYTGGMRTVMGNNTHRPYDIHVYHPYRQPASMYI